ncbi:MAG: DNA helicase RecQ [Planctomycetes bacterium]|nr:DNA helicase RecQ [Planctomycetota bacterium]
MTTRVSTSSVSLSTIVAEVERFWGYRTLRPLQEEAIRAGLEQRDSLVVMPTGGGKSLCYQVPPLISDHFGIVVSPLISLMKDQVDGLRECGYPAAAIYSGLTGVQVRKITTQAEAGELKLLFVAPERLMTESFQRWLDDLNVHSFAIDEAHCISQWGHDFRPEYRQLAMLKRRFRNASVHAFTATATPRVREDIVAQLGLVEPHVLVGIFDRPNLVYRVIPRVDVHGQILDVVRRHPRQAVIVYCISRRDTETTAEFLKASGIKAAAYHAGLTPEERRTTQEAFSEERLDVVVATVAFGMGIDRSDVRCVIHAAMPKSVEHYQQETGRAGRDGLEAECVLFYSGGDRIRWESLIEKSAEEAYEPEAVIAAAKELLGHMQRFCNSPNCRHRVLSEYFGQAYERENCEACDTCLDETDVLPESTLMAKKILSCVARVGERFGGGHVADVLLGANTEMVRTCRHETLSTYGLLKGENRKSLMSLISQLVDQGLLDRSPGDRPVLKLNDASWRVMRGQADVKLIRPAGVKKTRVDAESWEGVDMGLFEELRGLRHELATQRKVPAFVIFGDATLRGMARVRPGTVDALASISGVGEKKLAEFSGTFLSRIRSYCERHSLRMNDAESAQVVEPESTAQMTKSHAPAFALFAKGASIEDVMARLGRARSTVNGYLADYIEQARPSSIEPWVDARTYARILDVMSGWDGVRLRPLFDALDGKIGFEVIRLVVAHQRALATV